VYDGPDDDDAAAAVASDRSLTHLFMMAVYSEDCFVALVIHGTAGV
jgi:hypothetical protein